MRKAPFHPRNLLPGRRSRAGLTGLAVAGFLGAGTVLTSAPVLAAPTPRKTMRGKGGNFGLGVTLGDPMGASAKLFLHPSHALQFDLGWQPLHHGAGGLTFTYLWHPANWVSTSVMDFMGYLGVGLGFSLWSHDHSWGHHPHDDDFDHRTWFGLMLRAPVLGLAFHWKPVPLDTVLEGAWSPFLVEATDGRAGVGLGHGDVSIKVRYYF